MFQNTIFSVECARRGDRTRFAKKAFRKEKRAAKLRVLGEEKNRTILLKYTNSNGRVPSFRLLFFKPALYFYKVTLVLSARATKILRTGIVRESVGPGSVVFSLVRVSGCRGGARARAFVFFMSRFF